MADVIAERARERDAMIELARGYVERLPAHHSLVAAFVVGSVARGDFNVWSDVDVVVVADNLPVRVPDRTRALGQCAPPRVQPIGFTPEEFRAAHAKGNPLAREAMEIGIPVAGADPEGEPATDGSHSTEANA
jgi:uncharacterized protein